MGPLLESLIVVKALEAIHPKLPGHIMENYGYLFTSDTPNFCDIQPHIWSILDFLRKELGAAEDLPVGFNEVGFLLSFLFLSWLQYIYVSMPALFCEINVNMIPFFVVF